MPELDIQRQSNDPAQGNAEGDDKQVVARMLGRRNVIVVDFVGYIDDVGEFGQ